MASKMIETECYKCSKLIDTYEDVLHPLCSECHEDFDRWMQEQLRIIGA